MPTAIPIEDVQTRDLLRALAVRLDVATGGARLELIFSDGEYVDGYIHERLQPRDMGCRCRRHAWSPTCPTHGGVTAAERRIAAREAAGLPPLG